MLIEHSHGTQERSPSSRATSCLGRREGVGEVLAASTRRDASRGGRGGGVKTYASEVSAGLWISSRTFKVLPPPYGRDLVWWTGFKWTPGPGFVVDALPPSDQCIKGLLVQMRP